MTKYLVFLIMFLSAISSYAETVKMEDMTIVITVDIEMQVEEINEPIFYTENGTDFIDNSLSDEMKDDTTIILTNF